MPGEPVGQVTLQRIPPPKAKLDPVSIAKAPTTSTLSTKGSPIRPKALSTRIRRASQPSNTSVAPATRYIAIAALSIHRPQTVPGSYKPSRTKNAPANAIRPTVSWLGSFQFMAFPTLR